MHRRHVPERYELREPCPYQVESFFFKQNFYIPTNHRDPVINWYYYKFEEQKLNYENAKLREKLKTGSF